MIPLETCLKERHVDLKINRLRLIRVENFPGADLWHFYLTSTLNSAMFLIKSQPGAIVWSAQEGPSHPPISHWRAFCFHDTDDGLFNLELLSSHASCCHPGKTCCFLEFVCVAVCLCISVCVHMCDMSLKGSTKYRLGILEEEAIELGVIQLERSGDTNCPLEERGQQAPSSVPS